MINTLVMAGGLGRRLPISGIEKPLLKICGKPMIERVTSAVSSLTNQIYIVASKNTPKTAEWTLNQGYKLILTEGINYPEDLKEAIKSLEFPILTLPADTPFINKEVLEFFLGKALKEKVDIITLIVSKDCFPVGMKSNSSPVGISLIRSQGTAFKNITICKYPELLDVDTIKELLEASKICGAKQ